MAPITGKTVYILGAGASVHTGAPLLRDFLVRARLLREGKEKLTYEDSFNLIFEWMDKLRGSAYYVDFDMDNLEHLFSLAEMEQQIGLADGEDHCRHLKNVILETLDTCKILWQGDRFVADNTYLKFVETLKSMNSIRAERIKDGKTHFDNDSIITFNYDIMLDHAIKNAKFEIDYCFENSSKPNQNTLKLLKLHGSTNWTECSNCADKQKVIQTLPLEPLPKGVAFQAIPGGDNRIPFKMSTYVMRETPCQKCDKSGVLEPVIIPPTWSKRVTTTPLSSVWRVAVNELELAFQIVVIGYSMPQTDTFFQYLLTLALSKNSGLHRVVVVNKDKSESLRKRYDSVFSRSLSERGRLLFLSPEFPGGSDELGLDFHRLVHGISGTNGPLFRFGSEI